ncbi:MAG TPA: hypothetical protein VJX70_00280 [Candidatus Acidoferrum sp.]|nr:hypothetical protein [Candidatus Acidoferrum sp.]
MNNRVLKRLPAIHASASLFAIWMVFGSYSIVAGRAAGQGASAAGASRACSANPVLAPSGKKKGAHKTKHPLPPEPPPACMEVKGEALEIQETLQSVVRENQWRVHENRASEDTWTFVRYVNVEELEKYADTKVLLEQVEFEDGKAAVTVRTVDIDGGFVRVQISAKIQGEGKSTDAAVKQPGTVWPLVSKGTLEQEMIAALETRYKHIE